MHNNFKLKEFAMKILFTLSSMFNENNGVNWSKNEDILLSLETLDEQNKHVQQIGGKKTYVQMRIKTHLSKRRFE